MPAAVPHPSSYMVVPGGGTGYRVVVPGYWVYGYGYTGTGYTPGLVYWLFALVFAWFCPETGLVLCRPAKLAWTRP